MNCGEGWHGSTPPERPAAGARPPCGARGAAQRAPHLRGAGRGHGRHPPNLGSAERVLFLLFKVLAPNPHSSLSKGSSALWKFSVLRWKVSAHRKSTPAVPLLRSGGIQTELAISTWFSRTLKMPGLSRAKTSKHNRF